jgi:hypothetical protein
LATLSVRAKKSPDAALQRVALHRDFPAIPIAQLIYGSVMSRFPGVTPAVARCFALLRLTMSAFLLVVLAHAPAVAQEARIGTIKTVKGTARVVSGSDSVSAAIGTAVRQNDAIETGEDGALGVTFIDNTTLSLGPRSRITLSKVVFNPDKGDFAFAARLAKGTFMFVSGGIAKLAPQAVEITTPSSTIGIRGTRFLVKVD